MMTASLFALTMGPSIAATTWYVNANHMDCSDGRSGTASVPFCTIRAAAKRALAGDTVVVRPAIYREQVTPDASGVEGQPITYRASSPGTILMGTIRLSKRRLWSATSTNAWKRSLDSAPRQVFLDGARLSQATSATETTPHSFFYDAAARLIYVDIGGSNPADGHTVEAGAYTYGFNLVGQHDIAIEGFDMRFQNSVGIRTLNASGITVRNVHVSNAGTYGIRIEASSGPVTVEDSVVSDSASNGILLLNTSGVALRRNTVFGNGIDGISLDGSNNNLVEENTSFRNLRRTIRSAAGIDIGHGSSHNTIRGNSTYSNQDSGIQIYTGSNDNVVARNLSYGNGDHGFDTNQSTGTRYISNTAYGNRNDGISIEGGAKNTLVVNNIAVDNGLTTRRFDLFVEGSSVSGTSSDYNVLWKSDSGDTVKWNGVFYETLYSFRASTDNEGNGLGVDPLFVNVSSSDFRLTAGSPALDSANAHVYGFIPLDHDGIAPFDIASIPNTGLGAPSFADRGAYERFPRPSPALAVTPSVGRAPLNVQADASGSSGMDAPIASFTFDFGDGVVLGPTSTPIADHTYTRKGLYTLTVTVTDWAGASAQITAAVKVKRRR